MNNLTNINSYVPTISDARLNELLPEVPASVDVKFYGRVTSKQTGYGTWRVTVELDINGKTCQFGFTSHDEELHMKLRGNDQYTEDEQADALDSALQMALDQNDGDVMDAILTAEEAAGE